LDNIGHRDLADRLDKLSLKINSLKKSADEELFEDADGDIMDIVESDTGEEGDEGDIYNDTDTGVSVGLDADVSVDEMLALEEDNLAEIGDEEEFFASANLKFDRIQKAAKLLSEVFSNGSIPSVRR